MDANRGRMTPQSRIPSYYSPVMGHSHLGSFENVIDPCLETASSATSQIQEHCSGPQMQRYLMEQQTPLFETSRLYPPQNDQFAPAKPDIIHPLPSRSPARRDSPFSRRQSSAASGAQSPRTESDMFNDSTQGPSTPSDLAVMSPYVASMAHDHWDGQSAQFSLTGIAFSPTGGCVNPSDVNPSQCSLMDYADTDNSLDLSFHSSSSFDGAVSPQYQDASYNQTSFFQPESLDLEQPEPRRKISPQLSHSTMYPDLERRNTDEDAKSPDDTDIPTDKREEEDEDYRPNSRSKPTRGQKNTSRRTRQKRPSTSTVVGARVFKNTTPSDPSRRLLSSMISNPKTCPDCLVPFKDEAALQKHIKTQHTRPFICVFDWAGCTSTFATKNEWKRHVLSQHLALNYWLCDHDTCAQIVSTNNEQSGAPIYGRAFRRKDLFTQHARRMHIPATVRKTGKATTMVPPEWEDKLKSMQENAVRRRCTLPTYMRCPAQGCSTDFRGERAWDDRMEHVAKHLERASIADEPKIQFGGPNDDTLKAWAASKDVGVVCLTPQGWRLCSPLKEGRSDSITVSQVRRQGDLDEDAEGEEYFG